MFLAIAKKSMNTTSAGSHSRNPIWVIRWQRPTSIPEDTGEASGNPLTLTADLEEFKKLGLRTSLP